MKHFTSLIILILFFLTTGANDYPVLQDRMQQEQEKFKTVLNFSQFLLQADRAGLNRWNPGLSLKNAAETIKLDSIVSRTHDQAGTWLYEWKDEFRYDSEMKNTVWISKEWNTETSSWDISDKLEMGFDNQGRIQSVLTYLWEETEQVLKLESKMEVTYDASGRPELVMYYTPGESSDWVLELKQEYTYNTSDKVTEANT
jgi:hypothetical protein